MIKFLHTTSEIRSAIIDIFNRCRRRRVALVAFVGDGAESLLPHPQGLELICWPLPGFTNPRVLRELKDRGVQLKFADRLHMKVYWAQETGAVVTSANLSSHSMGSGNVKEAGILLPSSAIKIQRLLHGLRCIPGNESALKKLERDTRQINMTHIAAGSIRPTFPDWFSDTDRQPWRLYLWDNYGANFAKIAVQAVQNDYGRKPHDLMYSAKKNDFNRDGWVLSFRLKANGASSASWQRSDFTVKVPRIDKRAYNKDYPFQTIQIHSLKRYPSPPFQIDQRFRSVLSMAVKRFGSEKLENQKSTLPSQSFIDLLHQEYVGDLRDEIFKRGDRIDAQMDDDKWYSGTVRDRMGRILNILFDDDDEMKLDPTECCVRRGKARKLVPRND